MEGYPDNWINVNLMINPETKEIHAIGGDREPGKGDTPYIGLELLIDAFSIIYDKKRQNVFDIIDIPKE